MIRRPPPMHALYHYTCEFDALDVLKTFEIRNQTPEPGLARNFIGVRVPPKIHPPRLDKLAGTIEGMPDPGNWHADIAEWAAALLSVMRSDDSYRIIELGCGWGCWLVNMGVAARAHGRSVDLIGIEGDANHLVNAREVLELNGFDDSTFSLHHGIAGPHPGKAIFPNPEAGTAEWGGAAIFDADAETLARAEADPTVQVLDCKTLSQLSGGQEIDLLHVDIQGAELDFVTGNMAELDSHVHRVLIGTHGRIIEGQIMDHFIKAGWLMEMERPAIAPLLGGRPQLGIDGVQLWRNPKWS